MTLSDAIEIVEQMTRSYAGIVREIVVGSGDSPTEIDARVKALHRVLDAAKTRQRQTEEALKLLRELDGELN